jgi:drug/metabolite transporter (DMT)-like permease
MWIVYSVLCALSDSIASLTNKKLVSKKHDPLALSLFIHGFGAVSMLLIGLFIGDKILSLNVKAFLLLIITAASAAAAGVILLYSLRKGDLSLIAPIQTITPLLILIIAIFFLHETPKPIGLLGIFLVVLGGIYLDKDPKEKLSSIMRRIVTYKPALLGVAAAALYALASVFDKEGLQLVTVGVWIIYVYFFIFLFILPIVAIKRRSEFVKLQNHKALLLSSSIFSVAAIYLQLLALRTAMVTYVLSIKRLSSVFAVVLAYIFLDEKRALYRLRGAIVMVVGAILIGIS